MFKYIIILSFVLSTGCISSKRERALQAKIFQMQGRILKLEQELESQKKSTNVNQQFANNTMRFDKIEGDIRMLKGETDRLRVGVVSGKLPGEEEDAFSIASRIDDMETRLQAIEVEKVTGSDKKSAKEKAKSKYNNLADVEDAFQKKHYQRIVDDTPSIIKSAKGDDKVRLSFLYAESLYKLGSLSDAAIAFDNYIKLKPNKTDHAHALMRMGDCFRHLNDGGMAKIYYTELIEKYPDTKLSEKAKERLEKLKKS